MKRAFTLIEMLVVVAVLVTLMSIVFKLGNVGDSSEKRSTTISRLQKLENCLSGYYAAYGCYPPVKLHASRDVNIEANIYGIQDADGQTRNVPWSDEKNAWIQVKAACLAQPVAMAFPYANDSVKDAIVQSLSAQFTEYHQKYKSGKKGYGDFSDDRFGQPISLPASANFSSSDTDWRDLQMFQFGVLSYLLPRYLIMLEGDAQFFNYAQWKGNNTLPCDPYTGNRFTSWNDVKNYAMSTQPQEYARVANINSQAVCARWLPNLAGTLSCGSTEHLVFYGVDLTDGDRSGLNAVQMRNSTYSRGASGTGAGGGQYVLNSVSLVDAWENPIYYYSPVPHQSYTIWSGGANGKTFPVWIDRSKLTGTAAETVAKWIADDIIQMSN